MTTLIMKQTISGYTPLQLGGTREECRELIANDAKINEMAVYGWDDPARETDELGNSIVKVSAGREYYQLVFL